MQSIKESSIMKHSPTSFVVLMNSWLEWESIRTTFVSDSIWLMRWHTIRVIVGMPKSRPLMVGLSVLVLPIEVLSI